MESTNKEKKNTPQDLNEVYEKPAIEIIEMEMECAILTSSIPDVPINNW